MKTKFKRLVGFVAGCVFACCLTLNAQIPPPPDGGDGDTNTYSYTPPPDIPNVSKYMGQYFSVIDTNDAAVNDTNLYNALLNFASDSSTSGVIQILPYQSNALLIKASHFDYSGETERDFALLIGDKLETPVFKSIDLLNVTTNNGWLVQGSVTCWQVTDPMYLIVSNISRDYNAFFRVIPYGGPVVALSGYSDYDVASNSISLHADISDLSGVTNESYQVSIDGAIDPHATLGASNTITIDTPYSPNGLEGLTLTVGSQSRIYDTNNPPDNSKLFFSAAQSVSLDFENETFLAFASDWCPPEVGTNFVYYYVNRARHIEASITDTNGSAVAAFSGDTSGATYISLPWNMTEVDGTTPYSNDTYVVNFTASGSGSTNSFTITNTLDKGGNIRPPGGCLLTYQWEDPATSPYLNNQADSVIAGDLLFLYQDIYDQFGITEYYDFDCGPNRNIAECHPYNAQYKSWADILGQLTNSSFSELTIAQAHGSGGWLGSRGGYLTNIIDPADLEKWVVHSSDLHHWRLRKGAIYACYSGNILLTQAGVKYPTWAEACGIRDVGLQAHSLVYKNCGLFFGDLLPQYLHDNELNSTKITAELAEVVDMTWVCGQYQYPGGCDPTYSWRFAVQAAVNRYDDLPKSLPVLAGYPYCVYSSILDEELRNLDTSRVQLP